MIFSNLLIGDYESRFHKLHYEDLQKSGLSDNIIRQAKLFSLSPQLLSRHFLVGNKKEYKQIKSALCFPYGDTNFARIKLFPEIVDDKGHKTKYLQLPKTKSKLYQPIDISSENAIYIVEGEKKTLAGLQQGLGCVGIGGIWNWVSEGELSEDFKLFNWNKKVELIPDSDVWERPDLLFAVYSFAEKLKDYGADVICVFIKSTTNKIGLDDFFLNSKLGDFNKLERISLSSHFFSGIKQKYSQWKLRNIDEKRNIRRNRKKD